MTTTTDSIADRARDLHAYIAEGRILDGLREFYAQDCSMQENLQDPWVGLDTNLERERAWLDTVAEFKSFEVHRIAVEGDTSFAETSMSYVDKEGQTISLAQVSRAIWKDGRIVNERFYHS